MSVSHPSIPRPDVRTQAQNLQQEVHPECAVRGLVVSLAPLRLYRIRDTSQEACSCLQRDVRVRLPPELPKHAEGAEPQVLQRERGEAIVHERHTLECNLD